MPTRVVQVSDCHLLADREEPFKEINPHERLLDVLRSVGETVPDCDRVVITGDMAHDEKRETYQVLREHLGDWVSRCRMIPGNHDNRAGIRSVFPDRVPGSDGPICFSETVGGWRLIGLDSHSPGNVHGEIEPDHLDWLRTQLSTNAPEPTLLFLHHPPISVGSAWLDRIGLRNAEALASVVSESQQIRGIFAGHIHHEFQGTLGRAAVYCTPATSVQFRPGTSEPQLDFQPPGFRIVQLGESEVKTWVVRVPHVR